LIVGQSRERRFKRINFCDCAAEGFNQALIATAKYLGKEPLNHLVIFTPKNAKRPIQQPCVGAGMLWAKLVEFITPAG
jgi:hypothetical protein